MRHFLDLKAAGGYVVAPPSFVEADETGPAGVYELLDHRAAAAQLDWQVIRRLLDPPAPAPARPPRDTAGTDALVAFVAGLTEGNRNSGLFWAANRALEDNQAADLSPLAAAARQAGLTEPEITATLDSARRTTQAHPEPNGREAEGAS